MHAFRMAASWVLVVATTASGFQLMGSNRMQSPSPLQRHQLSPRSNHHLSTLHQSNEDEEEEGEMVEFFVSPEQIGLLRKDAIKRDSNKKLPKFYLPADQSMEITQETINEISNLFKTSELIELRGVSKDIKKQVFDTAYGMAATLEDTIEKPVVVVDTKGFAVKLYCPWDESNTADGRIQLRTSYKPGQWTRKPKAIRDNKGQVVLDESGKSIKEIPQ
eukprot:CAMPEP_0201899636 /NCGR_PEP_ID=MMETSP0902-20130614/50822_1 /ASSEMBLY_ACC=CAM_ASM_000551 /TAXON_ID=420261 /ORGANISM="Thalassiosira antarctica, Strain CCMP982" /LENGTH=218 /DNA_ID=CAMNT_0048433087 /DNA_START=27 /DNA_END=683 /DNA_ORIENTATION=+